MERKSLRELSRLFKAEKANNPNAVATLKLVASTVDKSLKFVAVITIAGVSYQCAADTGKVKTFPDVDTFLKYAATAAETGNGVYNVEVDTGAVLASYVPTNMKTWAESQIVRLGKSKLSQQAVISDIDTQLGLMVGWENGNAAQQAKKAEVQAQRACVVTDIAAIDAEVVRLQAIAAA